MLRYVEPEALNFSLKSVSCREPHELMGHVLTQSRTTILADVLPMRTSSQEQLNYIFKGHLSSMNPKHVQIRVEQCLVLAKASNCPRRKFGALLVDPHRNVILADGYNGGPRGGGHLCGGNTCLRDQKFIPSGTQTEIGCHHAEMNVICNAAANGTSTREAWLIVTGEPCLMCAKLIHHAGIQRVLCVENGYAGGSEGPEYLLAHGVELQYVLGPSDPRVTPA